MGTLQNRTVLEAPLIQSQRRNLKLFSKETQKLNLGSLRTSFRLKAYHHNRSTSSYSFFSRNCGDPVITLAANSFHISPFIYLSQDTFAFKPTTASLSLFMKRTHTSCSASWGILAVSH